MAKKPKKTEILDDLLQQLEDQEIHGSHYRDLVFDYMALWELKNELFTDIKKRGAMIEWQNGENQKGVRKNDAVVEVPRINKQMVALLKELGLRAIDSKADDTDDEY